MKFADLFFMFAFLPICFTAYFACRNIKGKNVVLIITSLVFYSFGRPVELLLFVASALVNYLLALWIDKARNGKFDKLPITLALLYNFGMLGVWTIDRYGMYLHSTECIIHHPDMVIPIIRRI